MTPFLGHTVHLTPLFPIWVSSHTSLHLRTHSKKFNYCSFSFNLFTFTSSATYYVIHCTSFLRNFAGRAMQDKKLISISLLNDHLTALHFHEGGVSKKTMVANNQEGCMLTGVTSDDGSRRTCSTRCPCLRDATCNSVSPPLAA